MFHPTGSKEQEVEESDPQLRVPETQDYFAPTEVNVDSQFRNVPAYTERPDYESEDATRNEKLSHNMADVLPSFEMHNFMFNRSMFEDMSPHNELPSYGQVDCFTAGRCLVTATTENTSTTNNNSDLSFIQSNNNDSTQYENSLTSDNFRNPDEFVLNNLDSIIKVDAPLKVSIYITKKAGCYLKPSERENPLKEYHAGDYINGYVLVENPHNKPCKFEMFLVSLEGYLTIPKNKNSTSKDNIIKKTFLKMFDLAACFHYGHIDEDNPCSLIDIDGSMVGFCPPEIQPKAVHKKFFSFRLPETLLDTTCEHELSHHFVNLPPSFGVDVNSFNGRGSNIRIDDTLGYGRLGDIGSPVVLRDLGDAGQSVSYSVNVRIIGNRDEYFNNFLNKTEKDVIKYTDSPSSFLVIKEFQHYIRVVPIEDLIETNKLLFRKFPSTQNQLNELLTKADGLIDCMKMRKHLMDIGVTDESQLRSFTDEFYNSIENGDSEKSPQQILLQKMQQLATDAILPRDSGLPSYLEDIKRSNLEKDFAVFSLGSKVGNINSVNNSDKTENSIIRKPSFLQVWKFGTSFGIMNKTMTESGMLSVRPINLEHNLRIPMIFPKLLTRMSSADLNPKLSVSSASSNASISTVTDNNSFGSSGSLPFNTSSSAQCNSSASSVSLGSNVFAPSENIKGTSGSHIRKISTNSTSSTSTNVISNSRRFSAQSSYTQIHQMPLEENIAKLEQVELELKFYPTVDYSNGSLTVSSASITPPEIVNIRPDLRCFTLSSNLPIPVSIDNEFILPYNNISKKTESQIKDTIENFKKKVEKIRQLAKTAGAPIPKKLYHDLMSITNCKYGEKKVSIFKAIKLSSNGIEWQLVQEDISHLKEENSFKSSSSSSGREDEWDASSSADNCTSAITTDNITIDRLSTLKKAKKPKDIKLSQNHVLVWKAKVKVPLSILDRIPFNYSILPNFETYYIVRKYAVDFRFEFKKHTTGCHSFSMPVLVSKI
ncbi:unnamed protein product [[Candida] boidinii]|uniref:Unnamed protein product n=1 Tax=Candida boidinii TaxID=5477 RepID=A0A9W6WF75_CANBO|nr:unnamed protein product [[Candida] boidinii]